MMRRNILSMVAARVSIGQPSAVAAREIADVPDRILAGARPGGSGR